MLVWAKAFYVVGAPQKLSGAEHPHVNANLLANIDLSTAKHFNRIYLSNKSYQAHK